MEATTVSGARIGPARRSRGLFRDAWGRLRRNPPAMVGLFLIVSLVMLGVFADLIAPYDPLAGRLADRLQLPSAEHLMGTDLQGRDVFSRMLFGARVSLMAGVVAVAVGFLVGGCLGAIAGVFGGWLDPIIMRFMDTLLAVPSVLLAIGVVAWLGRGLGQVMLAVGITYTPVFARLLRGSILSLREIDYVIAARSAGASRMRILVRHMLPNALTPMIVQGTLSLGTAIVTVTALGFLGLGPPDPRTAEWGVMLTDSIRFLRIAPYLLFFPGAAIVLAVIGFNLLGDGVREALDPRQRR